MKTKFSDTDLGCLIGDEWGLFGNRIRREKDGLHLDENGEHDSCWFHPEPENPVLPFPFTLEQFRAFCDWHPTFQWEAIESVFTNDDGSLDDAAIDRLNPASGAADLVRAILAVHDAEFLRVWAIHEELAGVDGQIQELKGLPPSTITEVAAKAQMLAELELKRSSLLGLIDGASVPATEQGELVEPQAAPDPAPASAEQNESVQTMQRARTKETLEDFLMPYLVKVFRSGTYRSGKEFHRALVSKAGADDSPFKAGTGLTNALYVTERGQTLADSTLNRLMRRVRQEAAR